MNTCSHGNSEKKKEIESHDYEIKSQTFWKTEMINVSYKVMITR